MKANYPFPPLSKPLGLKNFWVFLLFMLAVSYFSPVYVEASTLPSGFAESRLATGLDPTSVEIAPDGRLFITEKNGKIKLIKNGVLLPTPFVTLNAETFNERGLQSLAFDPNFSTNGYLYVYYTVPAIGNVPIHNRVSRFTANGDVALAGSELVLLELDNLPGSVHNGGALFFRDGKLFITTGESGSANLAQSMTSLLGKVLRINTDGSIPTDNPFYSSATGKYRAIWALGLRNPFKATVQAGTGKIYINDVGNSTYEEINEGIAGKNYGWPTIEGFRTNQTPPANYQNPVFAYPHSQGCSITGGAFYNSATNSFPASYTGKYFYADYCNGYIKTLDVANGNATANFATGINRPIDIKVAPDGSLYYIARGGLGGGSTGDNTSSNNGELWKVNYTASNAPTIAVHPASQSVSAGGSVTFITSANGSAPLSYQWQRNGVNITGATSSSYTLTNAALSDNGATFRVIVSNSVGSVTSNAATLTVSSNQTPTATITTPATGTLYIGGQTISFAGTGTDPEDGNLPASAFTWWIDFHHDTHTHPALEQTTGVTSGTYTVPTTGETSSNVWYRIYLKVTDSKGQSQTTYRDVFPQKVTITLTSNPSGLQLKLDGQGITTPYTFTGVVGILRSIEVVSTQTLNGTTYQFTTWSDGGAALHTVSTPATNTTYTATFTSTSLRTPENPAGAVSGLDYQYYEGAWSALPDFAALTPVKTGTVTNVDLTPRNRNEDFGFRFTGYIQVPTDGVYTFYTSSDDGSKLYIGTTEVVNNDGLHSNAEQSGTIGLKAGKHALTVTFFERGGDEVLTVSYAGPGITKQAVPATAFYRASPVLPVVTALEAEEAAKVGVVNATLHTGYTGAGFGDYINASGDYLEWTATVPSAGTYTLEFRYGLLASASNGSNRPLEIRVNGTVTQASLAFPGRPAWTDWGTVSTTATLVAGENTIRATAIGYSGPNIDHLKVGLAPAARFAKSNIRPAINLEKAPAVVTSYPVPATYTLTIESSTELESDIRLTNAQGIAVKAESIRKDTHQQVLNVAGLKAGMYFYTVQTQGKSITQKVVIQP